MELPPELKPQRALEDKAIKLGKERNRLEERLAQIIEEAVQLMGEAEQGGVSIDRLAGLIQVSGPTLYRWRESIAILRADSAEATERSA